MDYRSKNKNVNHTEKKTISGFKAQKYNLKSAGNKKRK